MSSTRIAHPPQPIWTPTDAAALRAVANEYPVEVGQSDFLAFLLDREGIWL